MPKLEDTCVVKTTSMSLSQLVDMSNNEILIDPRFQRRNARETKDKEDYIHSVYSELAPTAIVLVDIKNSIYSCDTETDRIIYLMVYKVG